MAFISTPTANTHSDFDLGKLLARVGTALKRLPLGEEGFTVRDREARTSDQGPRHNGRKSDYRPTYALQVV